MKKNAPITLSTYVANTRKQMEDEEERLKQHEKEFQIKIVDFELYSDQFK